MHLEQPAGVQTTRSMAMAAAVSILVCGLSSCARNDLEWTEDVRLPDGRVITLERYTEFKGGSSQFGEPSTESLQRFEFKHPTTSEVVRWESTKERGLLKTVALWLDNGTPVLLTEPAYVAELRRLNCPNPPYLLFEHVSGQWRNRPLAQVGVDQLRSNSTTHPLEKRKDIESNGRRLSVHETTDSYAFHKGTRRVPYVLRFKGMPDQTFGEKNCNDPTRTFDDLLHIEGK